MEKCCVFLRGINVGGVKIKMDDLKKAFKSLSYENAMTVLATGNVVITPLAELHLIKPFLEQGLSAYFGYDAAVQLRSRQDLRAALEAARRAPVPAGFHIYALLCDSSGTVLELSELFQALPHKDGEAFIPLSVDALWLVPEGQTLDSAFGTKVLGDKKFKNRLTSRNIRTIEKILTVIDG